MKLRAIVPILVVGFVIPTMCRCQMSPVPLMDYQSISVDQLAQVQRNQDQDIFWGYFGPENRFTLNTFLEYLNLAGRNRPTTVYVYDKPTLFDSSLTIFEHDSLKSVSAVHPQWFIDSLHIIRQLNPSIHIVGIAPAYCDSIYRPIDKLFEVSHDTSLHILLKEANRHVNGMVQKNNMIDKGQQDSVISVLTELTNFIHKKSDEERFYAILVRHSFIRHLYAHRHILRPHFEKDIVQRYNNATWEDFQAAHDGSETEAHSTFFLPNYMCGKTTTYTTMESPSFFSSYNRIDNHRTVNIATILDNPDESILTANRLSIDAKSGSCLSQYLCGQSENHNVHIILPLAIRTRCKVFLHRDLHINTRLINKNYHFLMVVCHETNKYP